MDPDPERPRLPLVVTAFALTAHPRRSSHWSLVVPQSKDKAHVFQLKGNYDTFLYERSTVSNLTQHPDLRGGCEIGRIDADQLDWLDGRLRDLKVIRNDPEFDCQTWVIAGVYLLKETPGIVHKGVNEKRIREELEREMERWDVADDIYFEREFRD